MCESNVYLRKDNEEKLIMENVAAITPVAEDTFILKGLLTIIVPEKRDQQLLYPGNPVISL